MRSILALDKIDFSKHSSVSAHFHREYIKKGIFDVELSDIIRDTFDVRADSDYDDYFVLSKDEVTQQIENAEYFWGKVKDYLMERW